MNGDDLTKGWAIVTGASSGIGLAFAREFVRRGHPVLAVARRRERLEDLAHEAAARGGRVEALAADLAIEEGIESLLRRIAELSDIDVLVNNAGMATAGDFTFALLDDELALVQLNVDVVLRLTHQVLGSMVRRKRGAIVNIASVVGFQPFPHFAVYAASKSFVLSFTEAVAEEVRGTGVRVLALCPGAARTEMSVFSRNEGLLGRLPSLTPEEVVRTGLRAMESGRVVKIVGRLNGLLVFMNRLMPRFAMRRVMGAIARAPARSDI